MLTQIQISNLVTIQNLQIECMPGTTTITGETGAGKSILIDAIQLALGERATSEVVREGQEKADISLCFDVSKIPEALAWLKNYDLAAENNECIIRRTITKDGRSRSYINGMPTTLQPLRELSEFLINIHGQHENQALLRASLQRDMLDRYAGHTLLLDKVKSAAEEWQQVSTKIADLTKLSQERTQRGDFLKFQLEEFQKIHILPNEFASLDLEHKQLAHSDELIKQLHSSLDMLSENEEQNVTQLLNHALQALESVQRCDPKISTWIESLKNAIIHVSDTENEVQRYLENLDLDPERLQFIEQRISTLFDLARKHKISPQELLEYQHKLSHELSELENSDELLNELNLKLVELEKNYFLLAKDLTKSREKAAKKLNTEITNTIRELALPHAEFSILLEPDNSKQLSPHGLEKITFLIKTNVGQTLQPLAKIASGGELSRVSLAIHLAAAEKFTTPALVFDEVDVGIGGGTAEIVGKLLRRLGKNHQVFCITHAPQVAAQGQQHLRVEKFIERGITFTRIKSLSRDERIQELARMLGGVEITKKTLAHASEMLEGSLNKAEPIPV